MVELAVIPAAAIGLLQAQDRDSLRGGERLDLADEAIADPREQRGRGNRIAQVRGQEAHDLATHLQPRHVRVQIQPIDALHLERHMTLEHLVDVRHARRPSSVHHDARACPEGRLCRPDAQLTSGRGPGGGPALPPLTDMSQAGFDGGF